jgi:hypothetical protein
MDTDSKTNDNPAENLLTNRQQQSDSLFQKCSALMISTMTTQGPKDALLFGSAAMFVVKERFDDVASYRSWIIVKKKTDMEVFQINSLSLLL